MIQSSQSADLASVCGLAQGFADSSCASRCNADKADCNLVLVTPEWICKHKGRACSQVLDDKVGTIAEGLLSARASVAIFIDDALKAVSLAEEF